MESIRKKIEIEMDPEKNFETKILKHNRIHLPKEIFFPNEKYRDGAALLMGLRAINKKPLPLPYLFDAILMKGKRFTLDSRIVNYYAIKEGDLLLFNCLTVMEDLTNNVNNDKTSNE